MPAARAPFGCAGCRIAELARFHRPGAKLRHVVDADIAFHPFLDEGDDIRGRDPRRAEACRDVRRTQVGRLDRLKGTNIAPVDRIKFRCCLRGRQLGADRSGEIGIGSLPGTISRILKHRVTEVIDDCGDFAMEELGDMIEIDMAALVEYDRQRISRIGDDRRHRRSDHTGGEDRTRLRRVGLQIIVLDRCNQPAIGIIAEGQQVRLTMGLLHLAGLWILLDRDGCVVDRTEVADECRPGEAEPHLQVAPRPVRLLGLQYLTDGIADRDQFRDDPNMLFRDPVTGAALPDGHRYRRAVEHLHQPLRPVNEEAAFADRAILRPEVDDLGELIFQIDINRGRLAVIDVGRKKFDGGVEDGVEIGSVAGDAGVRLAKRPRGEGMGAEHEVGMACKPAVHADRTLIVDSRPHLINIKPDLIAFRFSCLALAEEEDVNDDIGAGVAPKAAFWQADRRDQVGGFGDMLACGRSGLVQRAMRGDEGGQCARLQQVDRARNEIIVEPQAKRPVGPVGADGAIGKGRIADGEIVDRRQIRAGEVAFNDARPRLKKAHDARRDRIELDPGDIGGVAVLWWDEGREEPCPDTGLKHPAPAPAETLDPSPDRPDDQFRREMGILGAAGKRGIISLRHGGFERRTERVPAITKIDLARPAEHAIGKLASSEASEADHLCLLLGGRRPLLLHYALRDQDCRHVDASTILP